MFLVVREKTESSPLFGILQDAGYELTTTSNHSQALALLFVLKSVAAVIVDQREDGCATLDLARHLRALRRDVPIILLCHEPLSKLPECVDACVSDKEPVDRLVHVLDELAEHPRAAA